MRLTTRFNRRNSDLANFNEAAVKQLVEDAKNWRQGKWGKIGAAGSLLMGLGTVPMLAGMVMPDASTRTLQQMREEDKMREKKGLRPLTQTAQLLQQKAGEAVDAVKAGGQAVSDKFNGIRTVNPNPNAILPPDLPPGSLR